MCRTPNSDRRKPRIRYTKEPGLKPAGKGGAAILNGPKSVHAEISVDRPRVSVQRDNVLSHQGSGLVCTSGK